MEAEPPRSTPWYPPRPSTARQRQRASREHSLWSTAGKFLVGAAALGGVGLLVADAVGFRGGTDAGLSSDAPGTTEGAVGGAAPSPTSASEPTTVATPTTERADAPAGTDPTVASTVPPPADEVASKAPIADTASTVLALVYPGTVKLTGAVQDGAVVASAVAFVQEWTEFPGFVVDDVLVDGDARSATGVRVVDFNGGRFESGSAALPVDVTALDRALAKLLAMPAATAVVAGHGDDPGDDALATARAQAALDHLVAGGVDPSRLTVAAAPHEGDRAFDDALSGRVEITFFGVSTTAALAPDPGLET